jgi:hypothetical protein
MRDLKERVRYLKQRLSVRNAAAARRAQRGRTEQAEVHAAALALVEMWRADQLADQPAVPTIHTSPPIELS